MDIPGEGRICCCATATWALFIAIETVITSTLKIPTWIYVIAFEELPFNLNATDEIKDVQAVLNVSVEELVPRLWIKLFMDFGSICMGIELLVAIRRKSSKLVQLWVTYATMFLILDIILLAVNLILGCKLYIGNIASIIDTVFYIRVVYTHKTVLAVKRRVIPTIVL